MPKPNVFVPITKVDAAKGIVFGTLAAEEKDRVGEVFDYKRSKPYFQKWSSAISKATNGQSVGNLRAMHGAVAAGKFTDIHFDDDSMKIEVAAKIVDKNELEKVLEGVYTGFSIGGKYVERTKDGDVWRYVCDPVEGSLVDLPCIASATFEVVKADGATLQKKFSPTEEVAKKAAELAVADGKSAESDWQLYVGDAIEALGKAADAEVKEPTNDEVAEEARKLAKEAGKDGDWLDFVEKARGQIKAKNEHGKRNKKPADHGKGKDAQHPGEQHGGAEEVEDGENEAEDDQTEDDVDADAGKAAIGDEPWKQMWTHPELPGQTFEKKADLRNALVKARAEKSAKAAAAPVTDALDALKKALPKEKEAPKVEKKDFSEDDRKKLAKEGKAMRDGSYPIEDKEDLENAVQAFGRAKNKAATKRHITRRAKALGLTDLLPADWAGSTKSSEKDSKKLAKIGKAELTKAASLWGVSNLVQLLAQVECSEECLEAEGFSYGVDVPKELTNRFGELLVEMGDLVAEVLDVCLEAIKDEESEEAGIVRRAAMIADLAKIANELPLVKAGARHSRADVERLNGIHDLAVDLGAECDGMEDEDADKATVATLRKSLAAEQSAFKSTLDTIGASVKEIAERVKRIEEQPLPEGTSSATKFTVHEKGGDAGAMDDQNKAAYAVMQGEMGRLTFAKENRDGVSRF